MKLVLTSMLLCFLVAQVILMLAVAGCVQRGDHSTYMDLAPEDRSPESFEPYLAAHPEDEIRREAALVWYSRREQDDEKLRYHTLEMAKWHPGNMHVFFANIRAFYLDPSYRQQVQTVLEKQIPEHRNDHDCFWVLSLVCEHGAIPVGFETEADRARWLRYYGLPDEYQIPTQVDLARADKAVGYYKEAIRSAGKDRFHVAFYSEQLANLLTSLERYQQALAVCEKALPYAEKTSKPELLLSYGRCLRKVGRIADAKHALKDAIKSDREGFEGGPGHVAAHAHLMLGEIALEDDKDAKEATRELLAAASVQRCCHTITQGLPLGLARKLLEAGKHSAVEEFCDRVLEKFVPNDEATKLLREQARRGLNTSTGRNQ